MGIRRRRNNTFGELDIRIVVEQPTGSSRGLSGGQVQTWSTAYTLWAKEEFFKAKSDEEMLGDAEFVSTAVDFTVRYQSGITETMRINKGGKYYDIVNIFKIGRKAYLKLRTIETQ